MSRKAMEAKKSAPRVQADSMRLDKYLKVSRIIKRRSVANDACSTGHITVNGKEAKPGTDVRVGDVPVSYTHLDVYKRQTMICLSF